ncbi:MAG: DUF308 domain-containing protein [Alphaproteobacteria bacterium]|nr:DUF308 domain-containing protein [Alphaproteobacteria bacterium]HPF46755.1 DUF308 domain-containing protein [Emcibacteraceae bacterium]
MRENRHDHNGTGRIQIADLMITISKNRNWLFFFGLMLFVLGAAAILFPLISSISIIIIIGLVLLFSGIIQFIQAFGYHKWSGLLLALFSSIIWAVAGIILLVRPIESVAVFTIILATIFIAEGILKFILALQMRAMKNWTWVLFDGLIAFILGVFLWSQFPFSALWAIGILSGANILSTGIATLAIAFSLKSE